MEPNEIISLFDARRAARSGLVEQMRKLSDIYDGDVVIPSPELDRNEPVGVANLIASGIDSHAMRIASVLPDIDFPVTKPGQQKSINAARDKRKAVAGWMQANHADLLLRRRARWLIAYAASPVLVLPDRKLGAPRWHLRNPLSAYVGDESDPTDMTPANAIFAFDRSYGQIKRAWPQSAGELSQAAGGTLTDTSMIQLVEYLDDTTHVLLATGEHTAAGGQANYGIGGGWMRGVDGGRRWAVQLRRADHRLGMCPVVAPGRITLGKPKGQFDDSIGLFQQQAKLMAMEVNAVAKSIWPDTWLVDRPNETSEIVTTADGIRGTVGRVRGGDIKDMQVNPGYQAYPTIDRLERAMRLTSAVPAELTGESASNIRTGKRGQEILSSAIDFYVQEHQDILSASMRFEIERAIAVDVAYFGAKKKSFYVTFGKEKGRLDYQPSKLWADDRTVIVGYAASGLDANQLTVLGGQLVGIGAMSKKTFMRSAPLVTDPDFEHGEIVKESLEQASLAALEQQAAQGALPLPVAARIGELMASGEVPLHQALKKAHEEEQQRQADQAAQAPTEPAGPAQQPGMTAQPPQTVPAPGPSRKALHELLNQASAARSGAGRG